MKLLGISIYAAALLAYTQGLPGNRWHHHKDRYEEDVEEIHYQVVTETPPPINETITEVPTSGVALLADDGESCPAIGDSLLGEEVRCTQSIQEYDMQKLKPSIIKDTSLYWYILWRFHYGKFYIDDGTMYG